jgi:glutamine synthetase adenylyltransferase
LVDKAMHPKLGCPPAKREDVRVSLYRTLWILGNSRSFEQSLGEATPTQWLKQVETNAKRLAKLLGEAISPDPSLTVELASDTVRQIYGGKALVNLERELTRLASLTARHLESISAETAARQGRPRDEFPRDLTKKLMQIITEHAGRRPGVSRHGPMVRLVRAALDFLGEEEREDATIYDWMLKKP